MSPSVWHETDCRKLENNLIIDYPTFVMQQVMKQEDLAISGANKAHNTPKICYHLFYR